MKTPFINFSQIALPKGYSALIVDDHLHYPQEIYQFMNTDMFFNIDDEKLLLYSTDIRSGCKVNDYRAKLSFVKHYLSNVDVVIIEISSLKEIKYDGTYLNLSNFELFRDLYDLERIESVPEEKLMLLKNEIQLLKIDKVSKDDFLKFLLQLKEIFIESKIIFIPLWAWTDPKTNIVLDDRNILQSWLKLFCDLYDCTYLNPNTITSESGYAAYQDSTHYNRLGEKKMASLIQQCLVEL